MSICPVIFSVWNGVIETCSFFDIRLAYWNWCEILAMYMPGGCVCVEMKGMFKRMTVFWTKLIYYAVLWKNYLCLPDILLLMKSDNSVTTNITNWCKLSWNDVSLTKMLYEQVQQLLKWQILYFKKQFIYFLW